jgi:dihydrofolate reductase
LKKKKTKGLTIIVAAGENNAIGKDNDLIWHLSDDLKRFKKLTSGHYIIMGRKTFESFPKPLPNRTHIVITRQNDYQVPDGVLIVNSLADAIDAARHDKQPYIIGGGEIYKQAMPLADKLEITRVHASFEDADTFFPEINEKEWEEVERITHQADDDHKHSFSFITYVRK